jgi:hypothetical protein
MVPTPDRLADGKVLVYFASRDALGRAHIARATVDFSGSNPTVVYDPKPVLAPGPLGSFDESGVTNSCLLRHNGRHYLYYGGWTLGRTVPFYLFGGCAVSHDGGSTFERLSPAPILDRSPVDPYLTASPFVMVDGGVWRMWYVSGTGWTLSDGRPKHYYHIKYAESADGVEWTREGRVCIDYERDEHAIARPYVVKESGVYRMWYSTRGAAYRIGYAESDDGLSWRRMDGEAGIEPSPSGWDSEMVEYACVFDAAGRKRMLYNGNGYGLTGIGHAVLDDQT